MPTTLTLQLVFDPSNTAFAPYGRFVNDPGGSAPINQRSKVWILNTGTGNPTISPDNPQSPIKISKSQGEQVSVNIVATLPSGYGWATDPHPLKVAVAFGRANHGNRRLQDYASPFAIPNVTPLTVCAVFQAAFAVSALGPGNIATVLLGSAAFLDPTPNSSDIYQFNIGITAHLTYNGQSVMMSFGHDPDMQVDQ